MNLGMQRTPKHPQHAAPPLQSSALLVCWQCTFKGTAEQLAEHGKESGHTTTAPNPQGGPRIPIEHLDLPGLEDDEDTNPSLNRAALDQHPHEVLATKLSLAVARAKALYASLVDLLSDPAAKELHPRSAEELNTICAHVEMRVRDLEVLAASKGVVHA